MKDCSTALALFLADKTHRQECIQIDLYTFKLQGGEILRWTSGIQQLTIPNGGFPTGSINNDGLAHTFNVDPGFGRTKVKYEIGIKPSEVDIEIQTGSNPFVDTLSIANAARLGVFDGAIIEIDKFFAPPLAPGAVTVDTSLGCMIWFYGRVADIDVGRSRIDFKVKSLTNLVELQQMPRRLYHASCNHVFGDAMCGYDRVAGKNAVGVSTGIGQVGVGALTGSTQQEIHTSFSPTPSTIYDQGTIAGLAGANASVIRTIVNIISGVIYLRTPFLNAVSIGDTFYVYPGCDHTVVTCNGPLNNFLRYGGFANIPPPELAV